MTDDRLLAGHRCRDHPDPGDRVHARRPARAPRAAGRPRSSGRGRAGQSMTPRTLERATLAARLARRGRQGSQPRPHRGRRGRELRRGLRRPRCRRPADLPDHRLVRRAAEARAREARDDDWQSPPARADRARRRPDLLAVQAALAEGAPARRARPHGTLAERRALPRLAPDRCPGRRSLARLAQPRPQSRAPNLGGGSGPGSRSQAFLLGANPALGGPGSARSPPRPLRRPG